MNSYYIAENDKPNFEPMSHVLFSLGSNLGWMEASQKLMNIRPLLGRMCTNLRFSSIYPTDGVGKWVGKYANCVAEGETTMPLNELEHGCKQLELEEGRTSVARRMGIVPIDIDIVRYDNIVVRPQNLQYDYMKPGLQELEIAAAEN